VRHSTGESRPRAGAPTEMSSVMGNVPGQRRKNNFLTESRNDVRLGERLERLVPTKTEKNKMGRPLQKRRDEKREEEGFWESASKEKEW